MNFFNSNMFITFVIVLILIVVIVSITSQPIPSITPTKNICNDNLTDIEYLQHMIPHHQVAVDMSIILQKETKSPDMQEIMRKLIWTQKYEIVLMKDMMNNMPDDDMSVATNMTKKYAPSSFDYIPPNTVGITDTFCDPQFFDPKKHLSNMALTDEMYLKHMIPHHQVAVDMSKVLLKNTTNDFMIFLAYRIIRSQQGEIVLFTNLLDNTYNHESDFLRT